MDSSERKVRVAIHADDPIDRAGLSGYVRKDHRLLEVDHAGVEQTDIFVVPVETMETATLEKLRALSNEPTAKFLLIVKNGWNVDTSTAIAGGVRGALRYANCFPNTLSQALLTIDAGGNVIPESPKDAFAEKAQWNRFSTDGNESRATCGLTGQEIYLLQSAADGLNYAEIAAKMSCSLGAVEHILSGIMDHLNVRNDAHAVACAMRSGVI
ncbi:LuxR C-terminal-related transcriptional regulator [Streptomyces sp. NPDC007095]|uniref:helix-turn-helix transcriptional regulator n=1 Tax=Streptomyces sp. NPDC007095 TaxID=3154482 RepID=UPI000CA9960B